MISGTLSAFILCPRFTGVNQIYHKTGIRTIPHKWNKYKKGEQILLALYRIFDVIDYYLGGGMYNMGWMGGHAAGRVRFARHDCFAQTRLIACRDKSYGEAAGVINLSQSFDRVNLG